MHKSIYAIVASASLLLALFWFFGDRVSYPLTYWQAAPESQTTGGGGGGGGTSHDSVLIGVGTEHPVSQLVQKAERDLAALRARQSTTLDEAVQEYRRRYGMNPPPLFDVWYEYAVARGTELIDEYDEIYKSLFLFWALKPDVIRKRAVEALGEGKGIMGVAIRGGVVRTIGEGFSDYQARATREMLAPFAKHLPDMDIAFSSDDEPRVVVPHEDVERMTKAAHEFIRASTKSRDPQTLRFSNPGDLNDGTGYARPNTTRFSELGHQNTWAHTRMSCPPDSPARRLDGRGVDYDTTFSFGGVRFVSNMTAFGDICLVPSVQEVIGVLSHPNVFNLAHDLVPIFSPAKLSTFHDILYPSPYYYAEKSAYEAQFGVEWDKKTGDLYWRGSTTGGYSDDATWIKLLRQSVVDKLTSPSNVKFLEQDPSGWWIDRELSGYLFADFFNVHFTQFTQCDAHICDEMQAYFGTQARVSQQDAWNHRYLLDMDGNGLSGRFYAFLLSQSLPFKLAYFREWHFERLMPWLHYVPVGSDTNEYTELVRYFERDDAGQEIARKMAAEGRRWADQVVRKQDMEVYMFRLLLEYGRLVDDNRQHLV